MTPPLDDAATRLLAAVDGLPIRLGERERVIRALDIIASTEWSRVVLGLTQEQLDALRLPAPLFTPNDLGHVAGVAQSVAAVYGFEHTGIPHLAVALVLTARVRVGLEPMLSVVAEAFGLGTLENPSGATDHYLLAREHGPDTEPTVDGVRITLKGFRLQRAGVAVHALLRVAASGVLGVLAVQGAGWLWAVAVVALVTSRDSRGMKLQGVREITVPLVFLRWPVTAVLVVVTGAVGQPVATWVLLALLVATDLVMYVDEALVARENRFHGPEFEQHGLELERAVSIPESFATRRRCVRLLLVLAIAAGPTLAVALPNRLAPLYVLAAILVAQRLAGFAVVTLAVVVPLAFAPWTAVIAVAAGALAALVIRVVERPSQPRVPVAPIGLGAGFAAFRADRQARRLLHRDRPVAAIQILDTTSPHPALAALSGWALLQADRPGEAKAVVAALHGQPIRELVTGLADLDMGNVEQALTILREVTKPTGNARWARTFRRERALGFLRAVAGKQTYVVDTFANALPTVVTRDNLLVTIELIRLAAEAALDREPELASKLAALSAFLVQWAREGRKIREFGLIGAGRALDLAMIRCGALMAVADLRVGTSGLESVEALGTDTGAANFLLRLDRPLEAAAALNALADQLQYTSQRLAALDSRVEALAVLHWLRHRLDNLEDRRLWWRTAGDTLEKAMRQAAAGQDWPALAELIESARLQLAPLEGETAVGGAAPFIRIRGVSRLSGGTWYQPGERPPTFDLEDMAAYVLGPGTWWWSTWSVGDRLYWTLVPPTGVVTGGVLSCAPDSPLATTLADLRDALPIPYPGEKPGSDAFNERVEQGALCGPPDAEAALARRLGELLPPDLRRRLERAGPPLRLAIAPALSLANVPWALVGIPDAGRDLRLVECARIAIAPPSGLLAAIATRPATTSLPLRLAVLNPGGALSPDDELPAADALATVVPADTTTVTATDLMTVPEFGEVLRTVPAGSSAVFACHTHPGDGTPLRGGLLVRPGVAPEILAAGTLIASPGQYPIPEQVLVLACESADLRQAAAGEWLVLGPALLWAGARRLVVTSYPIPDDDVVDRALIGSLLDGIDLADALRSAQLEQLAQWRSGAPAFPVTWGGHIAMGAFGHAHLQATHTRPSHYVHRSVLTLVDDAARLAAGQRRTVVTVSDLLLELGVYGYEENLPRGRRMLVMAVGRAAWLVRSRRSAPDANVSLSPEVRSLLASASQVADHARHHVLHTEHLLVAMLAAEGQLAGVARRLSGWDGRQPEVVKELVGETQDSFQQVELPIVHFLSNAAVEEVYGTCAVEVPETEDDS